MSGSRDALDDDVSGMSRGFGCEFGGGADERDELGGEGGGEAGFGEILDGFGPIGRRRGVVRLSRGHSTATRQY